MYDIDRLKKLIAEVDKNSDFSQSTKDWLIMMLEKVLTGVTDPLEAFLHLVTIIGWYSKDIRLSAEQIEKLSPPPMPPRGDTTVHLFYWFAYIEDDRTADYKLRELPLFTGRAYPTINNSHSQLWDQLSDEQREEWKQKLLDRGWERESKYARKPPNL